MSQKGKTVVVGMSGGVDSSVSALLLKEQGYQVVGIFMKNWEEIDPDSGQCSSQKDFEDVAKTCAKIDIPYYTVNFVKEYKDLVFKEFLEEYKKGHTPNPDILCNREIKFKMFYDKAMELGADYIATGHYCQNIEGKLHKGLDGNKDQSYFLYAINGNVLKNVLFPIGGMEKTQVRKIAQTYDLTVSDKKDSTGICFIGERRFDKFLSEYISTKPGPFKTLDGKVVGQHQGVSFYTVGQRRHLNLGGQGNRWFVIEKDVPNNVVYVERDPNHPRLFTQKIIADQINWISPPTFKTPYLCQAKIRYRQEDQTCTIESLDNKHLTISFKEPQKSVAIRQSIVFYEGAQCLGGAQIKKITSL